MLVIVGIMILVATRIMEKDVENRQKNAVIDCRNLTIEEILELS